MPARIRFAAPPGGTYVATIERLSDGLAWDGTAFSSPGATTKWFPLKESGPPWPGQYRGLIDPTAGWNGNFAVNVHQLFAPNLLGPVVAVLPLVMFNGDDAPPPPATITVTSNVPVTTFTPKAAV